MGEHGVGEAFEQAGVVVFAELFGDGVLDFVTGDRGVCVPAARDATIEANSSIETSSTRSRERLRVDGRIATVLSGSQHCRRAVSVVRW